MNARVSARAFVFHGVERAALAIAAMAVVFGALACDGRRDQAPAARGGRAQPAQPAQRDTAQAGGDVIDSDAPADTTPDNENAAWITDANAVALAGLMNARQLAAANLELEAWHTDTIRAYAAAVAHEHAALQHTIDSVAQHLRLAPVVSALGLRIDSAFQRSVDSLRGLRGAPLEHAFVQQQAGAEQAIATYATQLSGAARAPEVQALMEAMANGARSRATRARAFQASLAAADSIKAAQVADSVAAAEERRQERAARRRRPPQD